MLLNVNDMFRRGEKCQGQILVLILIVMDPG